MRLPSAQKKSGVSFPQKHIAKPEPTPERLGAFSDAVFAVIITIMVFRVGGAGSGRGRGGSARMRRITQARAFLTLGMFVVAMPLSLKFPWWGFGSVCCVLFVYLWPEGLRFAHEDVAHSET